MRRAPSAPPELPGYTPLQLLGSGGFADVFLYEQRLPRRKVAVKVLLTEELGRDHRAQFVAEANLMAQLSAHPFIVTIFHADVSADGRPYFVMEYCSGPSLSERYKRERFKIEDALRTGIRLSGAIATAHGAGILHRDIKPANVLTNDYGWPALTDFGISSNLEGELPAHTFTSPVDASSTSSSQSAVGMSVPWSPPEMFEDDPKPDQRSDVFSLAATVHTLLAGRTPFELPGRPNGSLDLIGRIERGAITSIERDDMPRSLAAVLAKGMSSRRADRFQTAVEFARALQRVELELGYATTNIEVPNLATEHTAGEGGADEADATRARTVQTIEAQSPGPGGRVPGPADDDVTRARMPQHVVAQPGASAAARSDVTVQDATLVRPRSSATADGGATTRAPVVPDAGASDQTVIRPVRAAPDAAPREQATGHAEGAPAAVPSRRNPIRTVVGIAAAVVVLAVVGIAIALSGTMTTPPPATTTPTAAEDAVLAQTVPMPEVAPGVPNADGTAVSFAVAHEGAEDGDRYRWTRADGSGSTQVADGPTITVEGVAPGARTCIDVQVQRGSKVSEPVTGCTP